MLEQNDHYYQANHSDPIPTSLKHVHLSFHDQSLIMIILLQNIVKVISSNNISVND